MVVVVVDQHGGLRVRPLLVGREVEVVVGEQEVAVAGSNGAGLKEKKIIKKRLKIQLLNMLVSDQCSGHTESCSSQST